MKLVEPLRESFHRFMLQDDTRRGEAQHSRFVLKTVRVRSPIFKTTHKPLFMVRFLTALMQDRM